MGLIQPERSPAEHARHAGPYESWFLDTGQACGVIITNNQRVMGGAPIFNRYRGWDITKFPKNWIVQKLTGETEESAELLCRATAAPAFDLRV